MRVDTYQLDNLNCEKQDEVSSLEDDSHQRDHQSVKEIVFLLFASMRRWVYILHYISNITETVFLHELSPGTSKLHEARLIGMNSYQVIHPSSFKFYSWQVGLTKEWFSVPSAKCDWLIPLRIARVTYERVNHDYFDDCDVGRAYKARLPGRSVGDRSARRGRVEPR